MSTTTIIASMPTLPTLPDTSAERAVRFHDECVLIPDPQQRSRLPRLVTKSFSLPLWRRRGSDGTEVEPTSADDYIAFKVSVPTFTTKSLSPQRDEFIPQSCLVQSNSPTTSSPTVVSPPPRLQRSTSLSQDLMTVPLRPCCEGCEIIWEECIKEGEEWKEKFTRGARRRRNSSSDAPRPMLHSPHHHHRHFSTTDIKDPPFAGVLAIKVDEVDKKRQNLDEDRPQPGDSSVTDMSASSIASLAAPIREEDEDQLFPLPSPKRSPSSSPVPSPTASSSSLALGGVKDSSNECVMETAKKRVLNSKQLLTPSRSSVRSPPSPTLSQISASAPLPFRRASSLAGPSDLDFLEADKLLSSPPLSRGRVSGSPVRRKPPKGNVFVKAGSGILKGVIGLGSPPMM